MDWENKALFEECVTPAKIVEAALSVSVPNTPILEEGGSPALSRSSSMASFTASLKEDDVIVDFSVLHFGQKEKNPLDSIKFYSKHSPNSR